MWSNRIHLKQWIFWVTFWTAQRGRSARNLRRRRLVSPFWMGLLKPCQKTENAGSALMNHSACIISGLMHFFPGKSPLLHSFLIFPNLLSNLAILILSWWCSYMPLTELVGFGTSCSDEQHPTVHSFWVLALCCPWACWIQQASLKVVTSGAQVLGCLDASLCAHIGQVLSLTGKTGQIPTHFHRPKVRLN